MRDNPFNPIFGNVPQIYVDNEHQDERLYQIISHSLVGQSYFITGVRGSGKTVFLRRMSQLFEQDNDAIVID